VSAMAPKRVRLYPVVQFLFCALSFSCSNDDVCIPGELGCECNMGACLSGLVCQANTCVTALGDGDGDGDGDGVGDGDGSSGDGDGSPGDGDGSPGDGDGSPGDGDGTPGDGDGSPGDGDGESCGDGELMCDGQCIDPLINPDNCGSCGKMCAVVNGAGGCEAGACLPVLSECIPAQDPMLSCNDVCAVEGKACESQGCNGSTFLWYGTLNTCETFQGSPSAASCASPTTPTNNYYRCCCEG
jgi:hypothetical protein